MIKFINLSKDIPYKVLKEKYDSALKSNQRNIDAISITSFNKIKDEIDSRYVNLKMINEEKFIFFTNYNSPKSIAFESFNRISAIIFWSSIGIQIRIKAVIAKTSQEFNEEYFKRRSEEKNALAISSAQSKPISSFNEVVGNYKNVLKKNQLKNCPTYWGGYAFTPYEIEFWEAGRHRLNRRDLYCKDQDVWTHSILQP